MCSRYAQRIVLLKLTAGDYRWLSAHVVWTSFIG